MTRDIETLRAWLRVALIIATVASCSLPVIYSFSPWRSRPIGRVIMLLCTSLAAAMLLSSLLSFWKPHDILIIFWVNLFVISAIAVSTSLTAKMIWQLNHPSKRRIKMLLTGKVYDIMKKIALIYLPALGSLYFGIAQIWGIPDTEAVVGTIMLLDTFLGAVLGISSKTYNETDARFDGNVVFEEKDDETTVRFKDLDVKALDTKDVLTFKVIR